MSSIRFIISFQDKALFGKLGVKTQKKALNKMREVDEFLKVQDN